jgi:2-iminobutanoate/2-iminopropanoate deaminase
LPNFDDYVINSLLFLGSYELQVFTKGCVAVTKKQTFGTSHVPLSPAVRAGDFVFVSGQVPVRGDGSIVDGGIEPQTKQVLENIKTALALAGATLDDVVKTTVWIEDARDFSGMNKVYATYFAVNPPARSTVESRLMIDIKVEIEAVAYAPRK